DCVPSERHSFYIGAEHVSLVQRLPPQCRRGGYAAAQPGQYVKGTPASWPLLSAALRLRARHAGDDLRRFDHERVWQTNWVRRRAPSSAISTSARSRLAVSGARNQVLIEQPLEALSRYPSGSTGIRCCVEGWAPDGVVGEVAEAGA